MDRFGILIPLLFFAKAKILRGGADPWGGEDGPVSACLQPPGARRLLFGGLRSTKPAR